MSKVITFSTAYPVYHPKKGQPTYFVEKFCRGVHAWTTEGKSACDLEVWANCNGKNHTIRSGQRFKAGDWFSPRIWGSNINAKSGRTGAYQSDQIIIAPDTEVKKTWDFNIINGSFYLNGKQHDGETESDHELLELIARNDGLEKKDLVDWFWKAPEFKKTKIFTGQVICWNEKISY